MQPTMRGSVDALASDQRIVLDSLAEHFKAHTTGIQRERPFEFGGQCVAVGHSDLRG